MTVIAEFLARLVFFRTNVIRLSRFLWGNDSTIDLVTISRSIHRLNQS